MATTKEVFDRAIAMEPGDRMLIPTLSYQQRESVRVLLYRERKKWKESFNTDEDLLIRRFDKKAAGKITYCVMIEKVAAAPPPIIFKEDGTTVEFLKSETVEDTLAEPETQEATDERMIEAMRADGFTDEQIKAFFQDGEKQ